MSLMTYLFIALGGAIGSVARAAVSDAMVRLTGPFFPWGTILINITGSFIIGLFAALSVAGSRYGLHGDARAFVMIGMCGGYTTFSSFSLQTFDLLRDGKPWTALANVGISVVMCLAAVALGYILAAAVVADTRP
ncbi:fluoride efflux transporter CrcB [Rhodomicrobium sp. Az07]|uniref:fluoride efflux transporter CrcB n=1 Tax=Rhodomicrobium sp. Az07 TaxID=2839034 RepID=UPI001BE6D11A|nr:fluoride efflux transporter CrcB [Rhodomicrobium sp. Az07]MBT3071205.1 fluoride efflux transporter CrcB [Rhodomicrobium sp. Az07]